MANPPFEPTGSKKQDTTDKSGAKHTAYSRVRHLARLGLKKKEEKSPIKESRRAEIIREAMKAIKDKKDKFQPDPKITDTVVKDNQDYTKQ